MLLFCCCSCRHGAALLRKECEHRSIACDAAPFSHQTLLRDVECRGVGVVQGFVPEELPSVLFP